MLCQRAFELVGGRQVDIAVGDVDRRAAKYALALEIGPLLGGQYLEGGGGGHSPPVSPVAVSASVTAVSSAASSLSSISAAETTCSPSATSNRRKTGRAPCREKVYQYV